MISEMKRRITLQEQVRTPDGGGGFTVTWQNIATVPEVYAAIVPLSGAEQLRHHQLEASVTHRITLRYRSDVTTAMRIVHDTTVYHITAVIDQDGLGTSLEILATVKTP
ncbi:MAG: phage head closure protein [Proteobacteria bacterium]|nr:phage head closure protein [Pseudomonadota bacterium]